MRTTDLLTVSEVSARSGFAPSALRYPQTLLAPQSLHPLVVDGPSLAAGGMVGAAETPAGMILGPLPQPFPQRGIRVGLGLADRPVSLSVAVLPGGETVL